MLTISSLQNPRVKGAIRLRTRKHRQRQGLCLIDGIRELERAVSKQVKILELFICFAKCSETHTQTLRSLIDRIDAEIVHVSENVLEKMAFGDRAEGMVAVAQTPEKTLSQIKLPQNAIVAVIEGVEKPGNIGAVLRSADAAGIDALVVADCRTDLFNPNAVRASMGTIFTVPVAEATSLETLEWLRRQKFNIYAARVDGTIPYTMLDYRAPSAIALGSETDGLTKVWRAEDINAIRLPMQGIADSLNIAATGTVLFYEALRQRSEQ